MSKKQRARQKARRRAERARTLQSTRPAGTASAASARRPPARRSRPSPPSGSIAAPQSRLRTLVVAGGLLLPACYIVYLLANEVAVWSRGAGRSPEAPIIYMWYAAVIVLAAIGGVSVLLGRRQRPLLWGWTAGLAASAMGLFAYAVYFELANERAAGERIMLTELLAGLLAFLCIAMAALLELRLSLRLGRRRRPTRRAAPPPDSQPPGKPLY